MPLEMFTDPSSSHPALPQTVIKEMHSAVANPDLQEQITDYAKAACDALGQSLAENCK